MQRTIDEREEIQDRSGDVARVAIVRRGKENVGGG